MKNKEDNLENLIQDVSPKLTWNQGVPESQVFGDLYYSKNDGLAESRYVFQEGNDLTTRFEKLKPGETFTIAETGFGTGLNFLCTLKNWLHSEASSKAHLHFISVEKYPLSKSQLTQALEHWPELKHEADHLISIITPNTYHGFSRLSFNNCSTTLTLYYGDASEGFEQLAPISKAGDNVKNLKCVMGQEASFIDAWFLDGFDPRKNPDMWSERLFAAIKNISTQESTFATFTASSNVRRMLEDTGFEIIKKKGFGKKREMLTGVFKASSFCEPEKDRSEQAHFADYKKNKIDYEPSWHLQKPSRHKVKHCLVIGAGISGCQTAFSLAKKNIRVTVVDRQPYPAQATSGNAQGIVYAKLSPHKDTLSEFNLTALVYAMRFYQEHGFYQNVGQKCGVVHLARNEKEIAHYRTLGERHEASNLLQWMTSKQLSERANLTISGPGLFIPDAGWLSPEKLCEALLDHPNITFIGSREIGAIDQENGKWQARCFKSNENYTADAIVIANAYDALRFSQSHFLPLKRIRGQVSYLSGNKTMNQLNSIICGDGYVAPPTDNLSTFGATYTLKNFDEQILVKDHLDNLNTLQKLSPDFEAMAQDIEPEQLQGRVGFRCTTPDYFPIVGPLANYEAMKKEFQFLKKKANTIIDKPGEYYSGLYCNVGYGSRALTYSPLGAEIIANLMCGHFLPVSRQFYRYVHPSRFIIRDLIRNKI